MEIPELIAIFAKAKQDLNKAKAEAKLAEANLYMAMAAAKMKSAGTDVGKVSIVFDVEYIPDPSEMPKIDALVLNHQEAKEQVKMALNELEEAKKKAVEAGKGKKVESIKYITFTAPQVK